MFGSLRVQEGAALELENASREITSCMREVGWRVREYAVANQLQLKAATALDMQSLRAAASAEQDRLRAQWQLEMEVREKRALQSTVDLERRLEDAMGALKHERAEAVREKQMRLDADEAVEDMQVCVRSRVCAFPCVGAAKRVCVCGCVRSRAGLCVC